MIATSRQAGFTLVEAIVSAAILSIVLLALVSAQSLQRSQYVNMQQRMVGRNLLAAMVSQLQAQSGVFPAIATSGGTPATYVFCFGKEGRSIPNANGEVSAQVITTLLTHKTATDTCLKSTATATGYEVHFVRDITTPDNSTLYLMTFSKNKTPVAPLLYQTQLYLPSGL